MKQKIFISLILICLAIGFLIAKETKAGADDNVFGWAWSESIGLISFNCYNDYDGDGIQESHCTDAGYVSDYGVKIDPNTGLFSGYAWAGGGKNLDDSLTETIGYISFNRSETGAPPSDDPCLDGSCIAKLDLDTYEVSGWARALAPIGDPNAGGWDGWIKLRGRTRDLNPYGVSLNTSTSEFEGWAWGGDDVEKQIIFGWISFNCEDGGYNEATGGHYNVCETSDYKVMTNLAISEENLPPYIESQSQVIYYQHYCPPQCAQRKGLIGFKWRYRDPNKDPMTRFEFQVDDNSDFSSPEVSRDWKDVDFSDGDTIEQAVTISADVISDEINYNATQYYWRVKVYDNQESDSGWIEYNDSSNNDQFPVPPGPAGDDNPNTFTTAAHAWPWPTFYWDPMLPGEGDQVDFFNTTTFYDGVCDPTIDNPSCIYYWTFEDATPDSSPLETPPLVTFPMGDKKVTLRATDSDEYSCLKESTVPVGGKLPSPDWIEIPPF